MADRVAVFNAGRIMQVGTPEDIYRRPQTRFVADFVGSSNVLPPEFVQSVAGVARWASLRPEAVTVSKATGEDAPLTGTVVTRSYTGSTTRLGIDLGGQRLAAVVSAADDLPREGDRVSIGFAPDALHFMEHPE
jgi:putative spermidine/putrescine transport system ATP-binding protein